MRSKLAFWCTTLCTFTLSSAVADAAPSQPNTSVESAPHPMRAGVRYTTPRGIGYKQGYATLESFLTLPTCQRWLPFLDVRGHVFDNGKLAANAGVGVRYRASSRVWGINTYYDYRNDTHQHYNQVSVGLESLGTVWDFRINGYLPVGWKNSPYFHTDFKAFQGHTMWIKRSRNFSLKGLQAEIGAHVDHFKAAPLYFTAGSYYLTGAGASTWGGEIRAAVDLFSHYFRLEVNTSYDHFFKWIGQAQASINIPFGGRYSKQGASTTLQTRSLQRVDRHEIIPVAKQKATVIATNPATGQPWSFIFVNNLSSSAGTYESPYPTLLLAEQNSSPYDALYIFPGDGTDTGMNSGITLQDNQLLLGAGTEFLLSTTVGNVSIPPQASGLPLLTNGADVITLANNNTINGLQIISSTGRGILGQNITNFTSNANQITTSSTNYSQGAITFIDVEGDIAISNSMLTGGNGGTGLLTDLGDSGGIGTLTFSNSTLTAGGTGYGLYAGLGGSGGIGTLTFSNSKVTAGDNGTALFADLTSSGGIGSLTFSNSTVTAGNSGTGLLAELGGSGWIGTLTFSNSKVTAGDTGIGLWADLFNSGGGSIGSLTFSNSTLTAGDDGKGLFAYLGDTGGITTLTFSNSTLTASGHGTALYAELEGSGGIGTLTLSHSTLTAEGNGTGLWANLGGSGGGSIGTLTLSHSKVTAGDSGTGLWADLRGSGGIGTLTLSHSTLTAEGNGTGLLADLSDSSSGGITALTLSHSTLTAAGDTGYGLWADLEGSGGITTLTLSHSTLTAGDTGYGLYADLEGLGGIGTLTLSNSTLTAGDTGIGLYAYRTSSGGIGTLTLSHSTLTAGDSGTGLWIEGGGTPQTSSLSVNQTQFIVNQTGYGIQLTSPIPTTLDISDNTFTGTAATAAVSVTMGPSDSTCLNLVGNAATGMSNTAEVYVLDNAAGGTLDLTPASTTGTNEGGIFPSGTIGACTQ